MQNRLVEATNIALALTCYDLIVSNPVALVVCRALGADPDLDVASVDSTVLLEARVALRAAVAITAGSAASTDALEAALARLDQQ